MNCPASSIKLHYIYVCMTNKAYLDWKRKPLHWLPVYRRPLPSKVKIKNRGERPRPPPPDFLGREGSVCTQANRQLMV